PGRSSVLRTSDFTMTWLGFSSQDWSVILWIIAVGVVCNASCALLGCFLVLRRLSLVGDAISHAVLPGIVLGFLVSGHTLGWPILIGAALAGFLAAIVIQSLQNWAHVPEDASMGAVFTSLFAVGVILLSSLAGHVDLDPSCVLYGQIELAAANLTPMRPLP